MERRDDHEESVDGLLENFVAVTLTALDDPACRDAGRCILLGGPFSFAGAFGANDSLGANASEDATTRCALTAVFAHVKYASGDDATGRRSEVTRESERLLETKTSRASRGGARLLARIKPVVAASLGSARGLVARAADD